MVTNTIPHTVPHAWDETATEMEGKRCSANDRPCADNVVIVHGPAIGRILIKIMGRRMLVVVNGEPSGKCLAECVAEVLALNALTRGMRILVDVSDFIGPIDWGAIFAVRGLACWDDVGREASRVAYVVRNDMFDSVIKVVSEIFVNATHRAFGTRGMAVAWLESLPQTNSGVGVRKSN